MNTHDQSWLATIKEADAKRPDFPGEHLIVLGIGLALMLASWKSRSWIKRALIGAASGALIGRAASGTGGISRLAARVDEMRSAWRL